ncbi:MAG: DUF3786 domain-containing protein [Deltaproteobacteria bacterium]|nr:DUF3786 domain-containing protein [Deltaproteobacteria bacterium]
MSSKEKTNQGRLAYNQVQLENLARQNIPAQAAAMGLEMENGKAAADFLGRRYYIGTDGIAARDGGPVTVDTQSVLAHYLSSQGSGELTGDFVTIGRLTGINVTGDSPSAALTKPLVDKIGDRYDIFAQTAPKLGGRHLGLSTVGAQAWEFGLPKVPMMIEFFEADEEFGADIRLLFDSSANRFVSYECLELMTMCLVVDLLLAAGLISDPEDCANSFL